jgi:DNA-binding transcriptional regulator GbsR (MarR family)
MAATPATRSAPAAGDPGLRFVEDFALLLTETGVPRMPARVFACVLADDSGGLTAAELAERLQVSPAAISGAVRWLMQMHLLTRGREPGARRDHYRMRDDQWYEATVFKTAALRRFEDVLAEGVRLVGADGPAGRRLQETQEFFAFFRAELPALLGRWRASREASTGTDR